MSKPMNPLQAGFVLSVVVHRCSRSQSMDMGLRWIFSARPTMLERAISC